MPDNTLHRWMAGSAQMPLRAFLKLVELLAEIEKAGGEGSGASPRAQGEPLTFAMGELLARCSRCDSTEFVPAAAGPLKYTSELACRQCAERVLHGKLIAQLAKDAVHQSRAMAAARKKRQAATRTRLKRVA
ncbi:MAG TPA: hypothetical protein VIV54_05150 [Burkholderiales bacterium]